jgi:peptide deformylase
MKRVINCLKEDNPVINKKLRKVSIDEGLEIAKELFNILSERKDGLGLAANQVGYDASVAVVNVKEPLILINPVIKEQWDEVPYYEGCLSFPKKGVKTKRYRNVIIHTEQEEGDWYFSGVETPGEGKGSWESPTKNKDDELRLLESICVQHEIDHLYGKTILDREDKSEPIQVKKKIGRNDPCYCGSGKKYKKCCINK